MKVISKMAIALLVLSAAGNAATGFLYGEKVEGLNKVCFYKAMGSTYALNIRAIGICPLTYNF